MAVTRAPEPTESPASRAPGRIRGRDPRELAAIFVGGAIGTGLRALLDVLLPVPDGRWPWSTFAVNIVGALLLGYLTTRLQERLPFSRYRRPLLGTGLCGGLTTFSTMQVESLAMLESGHVGLAVGYLAARVAAGLLALQLATQAVRRVPVIRR
jgi:CrcB protein